MPQAAEPKHSDGCASRLQRLGNSRLVASANPCRAGSRFMIDAPPAVFRAPQACPASAPAERHYLETVRCGVARGSALAADIDAVVYPRLLYGMRLCCTT